MSEWDKPKHPLEEPCHEGNCPIAKLAKLIETHRLQEREYHERQHQETRALIRSFYDELRQRIENLEQRGQG